METTTFIFLLALNILTAAHCALCSIRVSPKYREFAAMMFGVMVFSVCVLVLAFNKPTPKLQNPVPVLPATCDPLKNEVRYDEASKSVYYCAVTNVWIKSPNN